MNSRLALFRWTARVVRREWRQHVLVTILMAFGLTIATLIISVAIRVPTPEKLFLPGDSTAVVSLYNTELETFDLAAAVEEEIAAFPEAETINYSLFGDEGIRLVGQDSDGERLTQWFDITSGRFPKSGEMALSQPAIDRLERNLNSSLVKGQTYMVNGAERRFAGTYENPASIRELTALVPKLDIDAVYSVDVPIYEGEEAMQTGLETLGDSEALYSTTTDLNNASVDKGLLTTVGYLGATLLCIQVAILASAGFTMLAQRRIRQLGLLAAIGATPKHVGSTLRVTALLCGLVAALVGIATGTLASIILTPFLQSSREHRMEWIEINWLALGSIVPIALLTALLAAWWPARRVRTVSVIDAVRGARAAREGRVVRAAVIGTTSVLVSGIILQYGMAKAAPLPIVLGTLSLALGAFMLSPVLVAGLGLLSKVAPLSLRVALRDIARNRARSAAAVAAASVSLAMTFALASFLSSAQAIERPAVPDNSVLVELSSEEANLQPNDFEPPESLIEVAGALPGSKLMPIITPIDRAETERVAAREGSEEGFFATSEVLRDKTSGAVPVSVALATPELLEFMEIEPPQPDTDLIVTFESELGPEVGDAVIERATAPQSVSLPQVLLVNDVANMTSTDSIATSWLIVADAPLTTAEKDLVDTAARSAGVFVRVSGGSIPYGVVRAGLLVTMGFLTLGIVAVAAALARVEFASDAQVLATVGSRPRTNRLIGAATVAVLTFASGLIAVPAALWFLRSIYTNPDEAFDFSMPWVELAVVFVVLPAIGGLVAWAFSPRDHREFRPVS